MPINLPTYEQQQQAITLLQELGVDVDTLLAGRVVKSVQRGFVAGSGANTIEVTINTVDVAKCWAEVKGVVAASSSVPAIVKEVLPNKITIAPTQSTATLANNVNFEWQVIEFY